MWCPWKMSQPTHSKVALAPGTQITPRGHLGETSASFPGFWMINIVFSPLLLHGQRESYIKGRDDLVPSVCVVGSGEDRRQGCSPQVTQCPARRLCGRQSREAPLP